MVRTAITTTVAKPSRSSEGYTQGTRRIIAMPSDEERPKEESLVDYAYRYSC